MSSSPIIPFNIKLADCSIIEMFTEEYLELHPDKKQQYELCVVSSMYSFGKVDEANLEKFENLKSENKRSNIAIAYGKRNKIETISAWTVNNA